MTVREADDQRGKTGWRPRWWHLALVAVVGIASWLGWHWVERKAERGSSTFQVDVKRWPIGAAMR
jgi:peptidoglycan/LPS O-acetylase OafA/YrhL